MARWTTDVQAAGKGRVGFGVDEGGSPITDAGFHVRGGTGTPLLQLVPMNQLPRLEFVQLVLWVCATRRRRPGERPPNQATDANRWTNESDATSTLQSLRTRRSRAAST